MGEDGTVVEVVKDECAGFAGVNIVVAFDALDHFESFLGGGPNEQTEPGREGFGEPGVPDDDGTTGCEVTFAAVAELSASGADAGVLGDAELDAAASEWKERPNKF